MKKNSLHRKHEMTKQTRNRILESILVLFIGAAITLAVVFIRLEDTEEQPQAVAQQTGVSIALLAEGFVAGVAPIVSTGGPLKGTKLPVESNGYTPEYTALTGFTFLGKGKPEMIWVDNDGTVLEHWIIQNKFGGILGDRRFLPNGNILFVIGLDGVFEMDLEGNIHWEYYDTTVNHHAELIETGNILLANIGCDCIQEVDYETKEVVWEWNASQSFGRYDDPDNYIGTLDFPGAENAYEAVDVSNAIFPHDWTHINYAQYLPKTDTFMVSLRSFDLIAEINRSGEIIWSFGPGVIKHQHYPKVLDDETVLIYDNGNGRVIRVARDHTILWEYKGLHVPFLGDNDLLPDGNYKIVQTTAFEATGNASDLRIVNPDKETLWKLSFPGNHVYRVDLREK